VNYFARLDVEIVNFFAKLDGVIVNFFAKLEGVILLALNRPIAPININYLKNTASQFCTIFILSCVYPQQIISIVTIDIVGHLNYRQHPISEIKTKK
jgi:hypothetical protein